MKIEWRKRGLIYCPDGDGYFKSHATRPIPYRMDEDTLRLFFSSRDADDRMLPTYIDVDASNPSKILSVCDRPLIDLGSPGTFDVSGVTLGCILTIDDQVRFYYTGWKRRRLVSFELSIGILAWDSESNRCKRIFQGPILAQDINHPLLVAGPFVVTENGHFRMWYCSGTDWKFPNGNPEPIYTVFYAESSDGIKWVSHGKPVFSRKFEGEVVSAPWVLKLKSRYLMWYSTRGHATSSAKCYSIGMAESEDGVAWNRQDEEAGILKSDSGWDSEMVCYPSFYPYNDKIYMFYCGNHVGRGGIGYAVAENFMN
jgi:hypothetical protein